MENNGLQRIIRMLENAHTDDATFPPTDLYNEGWMLRILLSLQSESVECLPFSFQPGARWFSEALIGSTFLPRFRGNPLAEGYTHLDAAIGHFDFRPGTKTGLTLTTDARQFVVVEAKMFSPLSKGIKNAKYYDQAARTIGCVAWAIDQSNVTVDGLESLGLYVIAPQGQIAAGVFSAQVDKSSIKTKVRRRVSAYSNDDNYEELQMWYEEVFIPVLGHADIRCISWESAVDRIDDASIREFYERCLRFNASVGP